MSSHDGHRQRMKERFHSQGLDVFQEHEVLEMLLYYAIPRQNTNEIAHELIKTFGSLYQVLEAPAAELEKVKGISRHASTLLNLIPAVSRHYMVSRGTQFEVLTTITECGQYLLPYFVGRMDETVFLLCLDSKCKVLACKEVAKGNVNIAAISIRRIVETALKCNASSVVLAHNHPSGFAYPSDEDIVTTRRVAVALDAVGVILADHVIVSDDDFVSLVDSGKYNPDECRMIV